jgi:repressor LexA
MKNLTNRQQEILNFISASIENTGRPPTRAEIALHLGFKSPNAAEDHLKALVKKGVICIDPSTSRGIRLTTTHLNSDNHISFAKDHNLLEIPLIGRVSAGLPILAEQHIQKYYPIDAHLFTARPDYLLTVRGLSMKNAGILEGDLLAVKKTQNISNKQIIVARIQDEVTVKRYMNQNGQILLLPENPDYQPITLSSNEELSIEGLVIGLIRTQPTF